MSNSPFYNPDQFGVDEKIKAAISSLKSELQSFISTEVSKMASSNISSPQQTEKATIVAKTKAEAGPEGSDTKQSPEFNYIIDVCINGEPSKMAISGQVLTQEQIDAL